MKFDTLVGGLVRVLLIMPWVRGLVTLHSISYKDVSEVKASLNWPEKRSELREKSTKGKYLRSSLQCLSDDDVFKSQKTGH